MKKFSPVPKWQPNIPVDIERTVQTFAYYSNRQVPFAVFAHSTCVIVDGKSTDMDAEAKNILDKVFNYHPDFNPMNMDDGNWLIEYSQPAYSIVFKSEVESNWEYIDQHHLEGLATDEVLLNANHEPNKFNEIGKIALFGRARMFMDAQSPSVVRIWKP